MLVSIGLLAFNACFCAPTVLGQTSIPKERPRARPPSALTGRIVAADAEWEKGDALLKRIDVPASPVRTAEQQLKTFKLAPGYRVELVAAEPLVRSPVFFEFDPDGRIWVVEYSGYMRDLAGSGEGDPICRVVVLEDTDGDGAADKSTVFLDKLVMPRSFAFVKGGVLLQEPPKLWFCEDTNGDLRCDKRTEVGTMGIAGNPQHTANGLRYGIDNWLHCADATRRYRWTNEGKLIEEETIRRGQFGVTFDETGRYLTCRENKALLGDYIPAEYLLRNRNLFKVFRRAGNNQPAFGVNVNIGANAQNVFPIRVTPGVTLGALELREDGRLGTYTIVSGACAYDGHQFPSDARGNVFVPESGGHLIGRLKLSSGIAPMASRYYPDEQEFLASTDERFRPVNARVGPDGTLYVADMYQGIIEHVIFMVPWLTKQIRDRRLDEGQDLGRIWRIVAENRPLDRRPPNLARASSAELLKALQHSNGWHRLTAQRLLLEGRDSNAVPPLSNLAAGRASGANPLARIHALWTLDGLAALDRNTRLAALESNDERVRATAVRLCERDPDIATLTVLAGHLADPSQLVRLQLALTLGVFRDAKVPGLLTDLLRRDNHALFRTAVITGMAGRELEFLTGLLHRRPDDDGALSEEELRPLTSLLAQCVLEEARPDRVSALFDLFHEMSGNLALRSALLEAFASVRYGKPLALERQPVALTALLRSTEHGLREMAEAAMSQFTWPGATAAWLLTQDAPPLTVEQEKLVLMGQEIYTSVCVGCHQPDGGGSAGLAPPLAGSDWVAGPPERLVRIILHGLYGPVKVNGETWNGAMPGLGASGLLDDLKLAALLSYTRRAWGNAAEPVEPSLVANVRRNTSGRTLPWRAEELLNIAGELDESTFVEPVANGEVILPAKRAVVYGSRLAYRAALDVLGPWVIKEDMAEWRMKLAVGGTYRAYVLYGADEVSAGNQFLLETEGSQVIGTVQSSGGFDHFREFIIGNITLRAGVNRLLMRPHETLRRELADVRGLRLEPVR